MGTTGGGLVLGIGIDWAEEFHDVAFGTPEKGVVEQFRISHGPDGVGALIDRALRLEPDPAEVRVVLETRHGLLARPGPARRAQGPGPAWRARRGAAGDRPRRRTRRP